MVMTRNLLSSSAHFFPLKWNVVYLRSKRNRVFVYFKWESGVATINDLFQKVGWRVIPAMIHIIGYAYNPFIFE